MTLTPALRPAGQTHVPQGTFRDDDALVRTLGGRLTREQREIALALAWDRPAADRPREVIRSVSFAAAAT